MSKGSISIFEDLAPPSEVAPKVVLASGGSAEIPGFLVTQPEGQGVWESLKIAFGERVPPVPRDQLLPLYGELPVRRSAYPSYVATSIAVHCLLIASALYLPQVATEYSAPAPPDLERPEAIYYTPPQLRTVRAIRPFSPPGVAGRPGTGVRPEVAPALGSTARQGDLTVISKPLRPDNHHQTVIQPNAPPDLVAQNIKLPNMFPDSVIDGPARPKTTVSNMPKPVDSAHKLVNSAAPSVSQQQNDLSLDSDTSGPARPKTTVNNMPKPAGGDYKVSATAAPTVAQQQSDVPILSGDEPVVQKPQLPAWMTNMQHPVQGAGSGGAGGSAGGSARASGAAGGYAQGAAGQSSGGGNAGILAVSVDPYQAFPGGGVPAGNAYGDFAIAPPSGPGSPGGSPDGHPGGGSGGVGAGGEGSRGIGPGGPGGGAVGASLGPISAKGSLGAIEGPGILQSKIEAEMVYALPAVVTAKLHKNPFVVSAGPTGGGSLNVYGALKCGKIYSIFMRMPTENWSMQFCQSSNGAAAPKIDPHSQVIHLDPPLAPPDPDANSQFDFKRLPVPAEKAGKSIVLKGTLKEDGTLADVTIYQGVVPDMDEAARIAFSKWKFRPAMRENKPVSVDVLIGIPMGVAPQNLEQKTALPAAKN